MPLNLEILLTSQVIVTEAFNSAQLYLNSREINRRPSNLKPASHQPFYRFLQASTSTPNKTHTNMPCGPEDDRIFC